MKCVCHVFKVSEDQLPPELYQTVKKIWGFFNGPTDLQDDVTWIFTHIRYVSKHPTPIVRDFRNMAYSFANFVETDFRNYVVLIKRVDNISFSIDTEVIKEIHEFWFGVMMKIIQALCHLKRPRSPTVNLTSVIHCLGGYDTLDLKSSDTETLSSLESVKISRNHGKESKFMIEDDEGESHKVQSEGTDISK